MLLMHVRGTDVTSQYWICALELAVITKPLHHPYKDLYFVTQANVMALNLTHKWDTEPLGLIILSNV